MFNYFSKKNKQKNIYPPHNMMLAFYIAEKGSIQDRFISYCIKSKYSHVELVLSDGRCFSASPLDNGVRIKNFDLYNGKWDLYRILKPMNEEKVITFLSNFLGQKYDTLGAIGSGLSLPLYSKNKKYCSLLLAIIFRLKNINQNPESLRQQLLRLKYIEKERV